MKTAIKREKGELWSYLSNMQLFLQGMQICLEPQNYGQYTMKTAKKHENDAFLVISLKHIRVLKRHANPPRTKKMSEITHKNDHKTRKRQVFGHNSQTCIGS